MVSAKRPSFYSFFLVKIFLLLLTLEFKRSSRENQLSENFESNLLKLIKDSLNSNKKELIEILVVSVNTYLNLQCTLWNLRNYTWQFIILAEIIISYPEFFSQVETKKRWEDFKRIIHCTGELLPHFQISFFILALLNR